MKKLTLISAALAMGLYVLSVGPYSAQAQPGNNGCRDPKGCIKLASDKPVRIATIQLLSGPGANLGLEQQHSVEVAIAQRENMVAGHPIGVSFFDGQCSPEGGQAAAEAIAEENKIVAVVGTYCSVSAPAAALILTGEGIMMGSGSNTADALTALGNDYFRVVPPDSQQGAVAARFAAEQLGAMYAATIREDSIYSNGLEQAFVDEFTALNGTILDRHIVSAEDDLGAVVTALEATNPDTIFVPTDAAISKSLILAIRAIATLETTSFLGGDGSLTNNFLEDNEAAEGAYATGPQTNFESVAYDNFIVTYTGMFPDEPLGTPYHAYSFDVANMIFDAIEAVATIDKKGRLVIRKAALQAAILATNGYEGLSGLITCQPNGECATGGFVIYQVLNGEFVPIP